MKPWIFNLLPYRPSPTGLSRYAERLLSAWPDATGLPIPTQLRLRSDGKAELAANAQLPQEQHSSLMRWLQSNALVQHCVAVKRLMKEASPSLIYSPYPDRLLAVPDCPQVITCHDLTPLYWPSSRRAYWRSKFWLPRHLKGAIAVVAISGHVADSLVENGLPAKRITVIPNGIEAVKDPMVAAGSNDLLLLARHARNKNIPLALQGFARFLALEPSWSGQLVIVGGQGRETQFLMAMEKQLGLRGRVVWKPYLCELDLEKQWRSSWALLSTSWMEGFDYPLLEAQARGLPTIASCIPVHEELHRDASLLVDVHDGGINLSISLQRLVRDPSLWQHLSQAGLRNAQQFTLQRQCRSLQQLLLSMC